MRRLYDEVVNGANLAATEEIFDRGYVRHDPDSPGLPTGPDGFRQLITAYRTAFPDLRLRIEDLIAAEDKVVVRWTASGTQRGALLSVQPTGRQVTFGGISIYRLAGGKIVEDWISRDTHGLREQLTRHG